MRLASPTRSAGSEAASGRRSPPRVARRPRRAPSEQRRLSSRHSRSGSRFDRSFQTDTRAEPVRPEGGTASGALAEDVERARGAVVVGIPFGQRDPAVGDDRAVPVAAARREPRNDPAGRWPEDVETAVWVVDVEEPARHHRTRAGLTAPPGDPEPAAPQRVGPRAGERGDEHAYDALRPPDGRRRVDAVRAGRRDRLNLPADAADPAAEAAEAQQAELAVLARLGGERGAQERRRGRAEVDVPVVEPRIVPRRPAS